jgi:hypothetical protein
MAAQGKRLSKIGAAPTAVSHPQFNRRPAVTAATPAMAQFRGRDSHRGTAGRTSVGSSSV